MGKSKLFRKDPEEFYLQAPLGRILAPAES